MRLILFLFFVLNTLLSCQAIGQNPSDPGDEDLIVKGEKRGVVNISYMMISSNLPSMAVSLENLPNGEIDLAKYPDAKLRVKVEVKELNSKYKIKFTNSSFKQKIKGFYRSKIRPKSLYKKGDHLKVVYNFKESLLVEDLIDYLVISIPVYNRSEIKSKQLIHCNSRSIKVINAKSKTTLLEKTTAVVTVALDANDLYKKLLTAVRSKNTNEKNQLCADFYNKYYKNDQVSKDIRDKIDRLCLGLTSPAVFENGNIKKASSEYFQEILNAESTMQSEQLFKDYSSDYDGSDPNYHKIYYQVFSVVPDEKKKQYGRDYLAKFPDGEFSGFIQTKLGELKNVNENTTLKDLIGEKREKILTQAPKKTDDKVWNETITKVNQTTSGNEKIQYYTEYLEKWEKYKAKANNALALLKEEFSVEELSRRQDGRRASVIYKLRGTENREPDIREKPDGIGSLNWDASTQEMTVEVQDEKKYHLEFFLPGNDDKELGITLDLNMPVLIFTGFEESGDELLFSIQGGEPPYQVQLRKEGGPKLGKIRLTMVGQEWSVLKSDLGKGLVGEYIICIFDSNNTSKCAMEKYSVHVGFISYMVLPVILLILLGIVIYFFKKYKINSKVDQEFINTVEANLMKRKKITIEPKPKKTIDIIKQSPLQLFNKEELKDGTISLEYQTGYHLLELNRQWEESMVSQVEFHAQCVETIHQYLMVENKQEIELSSTIMPELGGVLLGEKRYDRSSRRYELKLDRFIPIPSLNDQGMVAFDEDTNQTLDQLIKEEENEELEVLGWIHTHPGWGVFMSNEDLVVHATNFRNVYQIAIVLDLRLADQNLGLFSRKNDFSINNTEDLKGSFFNWNDLLKRNSTYSIKDLRTPRFL